MGINRYRKPALRLHYAVNDAKSVTAALRKVGFPERNIITLLDEGATARAIRTAFNTLVGKTRSQDRVFIFVATHGMTFDRPGGGAMGYLLPVEADPANILGTAIPMSEVKDMAALFKAKHVFFAVDACFSGLLAARVAPRAEKRVDAAYLTRGRLRQILTAGERDQPVLEEGGHGLFTRRLLEAMEGEADNSPRDGVLTAMEVAAFVQGRVIASSSSCQTPFFGTMEGVGQFVFTAPGLGKGVAVAKQPDSGLSRERARPQVAVGPGTPHQIGSGLDTMVLVPAGKFIMGLSGRMLKELLSRCDTCRRSSFSSYLPRRRVYLDAFYIDKYPVTNAQFRAARMRPEKDYGSRFNEDRQPVVGVTWYQARDYCKSVGRRLPTEAEWEKAARGVDGRKYPWGNRWDHSKMIWRENGDGNTHPVDRTYDTNRSPYGAVDLAGNVREWVADWYAKDYYRNAPNRNPKGPPSGDRDMRVVRGSSWESGSLVDLFTFHRSLSEPEAAYDTRSFRCAKAATQIASVVEKPVPKGREPFTPPRNVKARTGSFGIQVGACRTSRCVEGLSRRLKWAGLEIMTTPSRNRDLVYVRTGNYSTWAEARAGLKGVEKKGFKNSYVIKW